MKYNFDLIDLNGPQGNAFVLLNMVSGWLKNEQAPQDMINDFLTEAKESDYDNLLNVCKFYTNIANDLAYENGFVDESDCMID